MIDIKELKKNLYTIEIFEPRVSSDEKEFLNFINQVTQENQFGLILNVVGDKAFSQEAKIDLGKWFKLNKNKLKKCCRGFARVNKDVSKLRTLKSRALSMAMPCPYIVVDSKESAIDWLESKLD